MWIVEGRVCCMWWEVMWISLVRVGHGHLWVHGVAVVLRARVEVLVFGVGEIGCWRRKGVGAMVEDGESRRLENGWDRGLLSLKRDV